MICGHILLCSAALAMTSLPLLALDRQQSTLIVSRIDGSQNSDDGRSLHPKKCRNGRRFGKYTGKQVIKYKSSEAAGTIIIDTCNRALYLVQLSGTAIAYGVGVGRTGFKWSGTAHIKRKAEWPAWHPPKEMIERELRDMGEGFLCEWKAGRTTHSARGPCICIRVTPTRFIVYMAPMRPGQLVERYLQAVFVC